MVIRWSRTAELQLKKVFLYISKDSYQNAMKVRMDIVAMTEILSVNPNGFHQINLKLTMMAHTGLLNYTGIVFHM